MIAVFTGIKLTLRVGETTHEWSLWEDPCQEPKEITCRRLTDLGLAYLGIYEFQGDALQVCFAPPGRSRPTDFSSDPASGHYLATFERVKA